MADRIKNLKIKSNVVKRQNYLDFKFNFYFNFVFSTIRIIKEKTTYEKEVGQNEARIVKMRNEGRDEYDIKKMVCI